MSRTSKIIIGILIGILVVGGLVVAGFAVDKALFKNNAANFSLQDQPVYRETLFDIKSYYFKPYDENKIVAAANAAVAKDKKKGVTSTTKLTNDGINAMVNALGDAHSQYLGFTLKLQNKRPKVVSVIKGSPSDKAGIKSGDVIMSVDGKSTLGE